MKTIIKATVILGTMLVSQGGMTQQAPEDVYQKSCRICHDSGVAGAPKKGVAGDWDSRLNKGMDTLVKSVSQGLGAMPPKGMCVDCSPEDFKAVIGFMSSSK